MKLGKYYDYYFENGGVCPECGSLLTLHGGCINQRCRLCNLHCYEDERFSSRVSSFWKKIRKGRKMLREYKKEFKENYEKKKKDKFSGKRDFVEA